MIKLKNNEHIYELEIYSEVCCNYCGEVVRNHIDCPICNRGYAETNIYSHLYYAFIDALNTMKDESLECECGAIFKPIIEKDSSAYDWKWLHINPAGTLGDNPNDPSS